MKARLSLGIVTIACMACLAMLPALPAASRGLGTSLDKNSLLHFTPGDTMPGFSLPLIGGQGRVTFRPRRGGRPQVIMFFSLSPQFRARRSVSLAGALGRLKEKYAGRAVFSAVYSGGNSRGDMIDQYIEDGLLPLPVLDDRDKKLYHDYGVFMLPLVLVINGDGALQSVIPYTETIGELVDNNLKLALGEWSLADFRNSLKPRKNIVHSKEEKEYIRRVNYGRVMFARKMYTSALREFNTAARMVPRPLEALVGLGYVHLARKEWGKAEKTFAKALKINKDSDRALAGLGIALFRQGRTAKAMPILENALISENPSIEVITALADIYEQRGQVVKAMRLNKLAIERLLKKFQR